ncbi:pyruvate dehydrogenase phosphatase regulatory subunit, mitochondrial isoform X2 [Calliopsis andreniformis]|uniref:pyruvate dehydrogenase phosphatase regulatory subunit, mitochondrial isoform X2 n=1 Tax=Calliopsis andreniformis TaxID=337506 RepID=UPI003FCD11A4
MWHHSKSFCNKYLIQWSNFVFYNRQRVKHSSSQSTLVTNEDVDDPLPKKAKVVICGGGVMGGAVAYHLSLMGLGPETVVVESGRLGGGTTWHTSGLVGVFKPSLAQVKLAQDTIALYKELEEKGLSTGWKQCGSLSLARTRDRMTVFRRMKAQSISCNIECHLVSPQQIQEICPLLKVDDLVGGLWMPGDGVGDPYQICLTLIGEAKKKGVKVFENCKVTKVATQNGKIEAVETTHGAIECEHFVNCAGFWARNVGKLSEPFVKVPLHPVEHYYLHTQPITGLDTMTPVIKDLDGYIYFRENNGSLLAGGFEPVAKPAFEDGTIPENTEERFLPEDWDHFHILFEQMLYRIPSLGNAVLERLCNGPEAFSPDCKWIVGEAPEIRNYYVAAGLHNNRKFLRDRVKEVPGMHYALQYPHQEFKTGRNLRMSPIYPKLREAGAVFGQVMGYERPTWFQLDKDMDLETIDGFQRYKIAYTNTFSKPPWFEPVSEEYAACRETVGLSDYSSFTKVDLWSNGMEVVDLLQYLCSNDVDVPVGSIIHTGMQNHRGGYENDCSLARIAPNHYMMIAPTIQQTRCKHWINRHLPADGSVAVSDVTSAYTAICIMGPATRQLLSELTDTDLNPKNFPFFTFKELDVGLANGIRTMNLTHTGELGYVLYIPNEFALHVYTRLVDAGVRYGLKHAGYYATRALRVEKFYAFWGQDLDTFTTPLECGRAWRVKLDKEINFIGRDALLKQREEGVKRKYVQLLLNEHDPELDIWCWGNEPIYRNGKYCGMTTTTGYGFTFKKQVCLGFVQNFDSQGRPQEVTNEYVLSGDYEVDVAGIKYPAKCHLHSPNLPTKFPDKERDSYHATRDHQTV